MPIFALRANVFRTSITLIAVLCGCAGIRTQSRIAETEALRVVSRYQAEFSEPPKGVPTGAVVDGPILGNGDIGVALAGPPQR